MFSNILDEIRLLFRKDKESYLCFYKILGFYPRNIEIYQQALLHKSSSVKAKGRLLNNERLEFLGDAILDAVVADIVYKRFEGKREGFLTNTRSKIVQRETLNQIAVKIGLDKLIKASYQLLGLISYLTAGEKETRAWTIKVGTKAPQAAGKIHTDFERGFIKAEVVNYKDLLDCGSYNGAKEKGLVRMEGKDYVMKDGDVVLFRFNV